MSQGLEGQGSWAQKSWRPTKPTDWKDPPFHWVIFLTTKSGPSRWRKTWLITKSQLLSARDETDQWTESLGQCSLFASRVLMARHLLLWVKRQLGFVEEWCPLSPLSLRWQNACWLRWCFEGFDTRKKLRALSTLKPYWCFSKSLTSSPRLM